MKISIILAHSNKRSFNHAIAKAAIDILRKNKHKIYFHDLYAEKFNSILSEIKTNKDSHFCQKIELYCHEIAESDGIIIIHPNRWDQPPSVLKAWMDEVLRTGVAHVEPEDYKSEETSHGRLKAKAALVFNTSNTPVDKKKVFSDPLEMLWENHIVQLCRIPNFYRRMFSVVVASPESQRREWLNEVQKVIDYHFNDK